MDAKRSPLAGWSPGADPAPLLVLEVMSRLTALDQHVPSIEEVAAGLAMSARTLRRKLRVLGTSYSEILQDVRLARAETLLLNSRLTVERISEKLGYTEPGNFRQAFRKWTGSSPRSYRRDRRSRGRFAAAEAAPGALAATPAGAA